MPDESSAADHPLMQLADEDREFVVRLVLASGSLKQLAAHYGVSYPTIRSRLDRVIQRLQQAIDGRQPEPMAELLADMVERGEIGPAAARRVQKLHRQMLRDQQ